METQNNEVQAIRIFLNRTGRTITWAAKQMDVSYPHFHHVLTGKRKATDDMKAKISCLLSKVTAPLAG